MGLLDRLFGRRDRNPLPSTASEETQARPAAPSFVVIDVETTGLSPKRDRIVELAVVRVDAHGDVVDEWSTRFNPEGPVGATHIHGITDADVAGAPLFRDVAHAILRRIAGYPIAAHNARFDLAFIRAEFERAGWDMPWLASYCTMNGSQHYLPHLDRRRLVDCCWATGVSHNDAHSALGDARATAGLLRHYLVGAHGMHVHRELLQLPAQARAAAWPTGPTRQPDLPSRKAPINSRPIRVSPARSKQPPLIAQLAGVSLLDVLDEGAPEGTMTYLELLLDALEDGELSENEAVELADIASIYGLAPADVASAHQAFLRALAHRAVDDGHVSQDERAELRAFGELLAVPSGEIVDIIKHADSARAVRMSADLRPLPVDWAHGEPLRVGDKVAFTGCDEAQRQRLEARAEQLGVRVMNNVSRFTAVLVTDESFSGGKAAKAAQLGTRIMHPDTFESMLHYLQPAASSTLSPRTMVGGAEKLAPVESVRATRVTQTSPAEIRAWALSNGYSAGVRGRLPREVVEAFELALAEA